MSHYKPYPAYKDSGVEWIGEVPENWKVVSLLHLFNIKAGGDLKKEFYSEEKTEEYPYPIYTNSIKSNEAYGFTSKPFFKANTITVTGRGEIGYAIYRDHEYDAIIRLLVLTPKNNEPCKYFAYCINSILVFFGGNTAVSQLSTEQISPYKIFCPPFPEQQSIVSFLDRQTARIDALITKKTRFIELLKEKRQALITHAVTKGLNPNVKMKDSGIEWIGEVPEHWNIMAFKRLVSICNGQDYKDVGLKDGAYPVIGSGGEFARASSFLYNGESVLLGRKGTIDKPMYINGPFWVVDTMFYTVISGRAFPKFVYYNALTIPFVMYSTNTALPSMTGEDLSSHIIATPDYDEQKIIADFLDRQTARIDLVIEKTQRSIDLLRERRSALITAAVTGKIDLRGSL